MNYLFRTAKPGSMLIDSSTIDPGVSKEVAGLAEKKGLLFMDAPVSGGLRQQFHIINQYISFELL